MRTVKNLRRYGPWAALGALALIAVPAAVVGAGGEVVVVRSSDLGPYKVVEASFAGAAGQVRSVSMADRAAASGLKATLEGAGLVFAIGPEAARAASAARGATPLLVALVPNLDKAGLDARVPAVPMFVPAAGQLRAIKAALPGVKRIGMLYDPALSRALAAECEAVASAAGVTLIKSEVASRQDVAAAARALLPRVEALWLVPDTTVVSAESFKFLVQTSISSKTPLIGFSEGMAKAGAVVSIEASYAEIGRRAAAAARRVLAGAAASPEAPEGAVYLNAKSAEMLGLTLPTTARAAATKVFE